MSNPKAQFCRSLLVLILAASVLPQLAHAQFPGDANTFAPTLAIDTAPSGLVLPGGLSWLGRSAFALDHRSFIDLHVGVAESGSVGIRWIRSSKFWSAGIGGTVMLHSRETSQIYPSSPRPRLVSVWGLRKSTSRPESWMPPHLDTGPTS